VGDTLSVQLLAQGEQHATDVAAWLATFIGVAQHTLDIAIYDMRLSDPLKATLASALAGRAAVGVVIRIVYNGGRPGLPGFASGADPSTGDTHDFVQSLGYPARAIDDLKLMHHKYLVRDAGLPGACVWTGSTNLTDDAWTLEENNILRLFSGDLATAYSRDFAELWASGTLGMSGAQETANTTLVYAGQPCVAEVLFSPGCGPAIDYVIARRVARAQRRVRICSMLLNSGALIAALGDLLREGRVAVDGVYDRTQMEGVFVQWQDVPHNHWKIGAVQEIIRDAQLVGKNSTPYSPTSAHDFMHIKTLVIDDLVITGSYNFSHSAELNAENVLLLESPALAETYSQYIDHLKVKYGGSI
jgi:phosphatidylserine/phosphatidylglycerophosphate/cardiolipin synthase-like enzyme